jgi:hypothetical protein
MATSPLRHHTGTASARLPVQRARSSVGAERMRRDAAPVVAAKVLLSHGLDDDAILSYLARSWPLDDWDCRSALHAAHILLRREHPHDGPGPDEQHPRSDGG